MQGHSCAGAAKYQLSFILSIRYVYHVTQIVCMRDIQGHSRLGAAEEEDRAVQASGRHRRKT